MNERLKLIERPLLIAWLAALLFPAQMRAAFSSGQAGTSGTQFLTLGADARALGMGEAMTSVPDFLERVVDVHEGVHPFLAYPDVD